MNLLIQAFGSKIQLYFPNLEVEFCFPKGNPEAIHAVLFWRKGKRVATVLRHSSGTFRVSPDESPDWNMVKEMDYDSALAKVKKICELARTTSL
jgi:hypothetical protein